MVSTVWSKAYDVNTMVVTAEKRLGLVGLLRILQDVAWIHGAHLGHGFEAMSARGQIWALSRQEVRVDRWPVWGDGVTVRTWVRPMNGMFVNRDYEILVGDSRVGIGTAAWIELDAVRRRPLRFSPGEAGLGVREDGVLDLEPARIAPVDGLAPLTAFDVRWSDLDANGHVNNTRYAEWLIDALPEDARRGRVARRYEVNFLAETGVGDRVGVEAAVAPADGPLAMQGRREADGKVVFTARLELGPA